MKREDLALQLALIGEKKCQEKYFILKVTFSLSKYFMFFTQKHTQTCTKSVLFCKFLFVMIF